MHHLKVVCSYLAVIEVEDNPETTVAIALVKWSSKLSWAERMGVAGGGAVGDWVQVHSQVENWKNGLNLEG